MAVQEILSNLVGRRAWRRRGSSSAEWWGGVDVTSGEIVAVILDQYNQVLLLLHDGDGLLFYQKIHDVRVEPCEIIGTGKERGPRHG